MYKVDNPVTFRENIRDKLVEKMKVTKFPESLLKSVSTNLEKGIYNFTIQKC